VKRSPSVAAIALTVTTAFSRQAGADDTIARPGDHPNYAIEVEPQGALGWTHYNRGPDDGLGLGARFSIPIVENGFVSNINDSVAISFGVDWLHYSGTACYAYYYDYRPPPPPPAPCYYVGDANYLFLPVTLQWNFFVGRQWSVFAEPGVSVYHGFFDYCAAAPPGAPCANPSSTGVDPAIFVGGRFHFSDHAALVMRLGYPTLSIGISFM
jgi:hypothetical protein